MRGLTQRLLQMEKLFRLAEKESLAKRARLQHDGEDWLRRGDGVQSYENVEFVAELVAQCIHNGHVDFAENVARVFTAGAECGSMVVESIQRARAVCAQRGSYEGEWQGANPLTFSPAPLPLTPTLSRSPSPSHAHTSALTPRARQNS